MPATLSAKEQVLLKRLKLGGFTLLVTLILHAIPGRLMQDAWPIVRWSMFSDGFLDYPADVKTTYWLDVVTTDCETERVNLNNLLTTSFSSARHEIMFTMTDRVFAQSDDPRVDEWTDFIVAQLKREHDIDAASMTFVQRDFRNDWRSVPTHDTTEQPLETIIFGTITIDEQACANEETIDVAN